MGGTAGEVEQRGQRQDDSEASDEEDDDSEASDEEDDEPVEEEGSTGGSGLGGQ